MKKYFAYGLAERTLQHEGRHTTVIAVDRKRPVYVFDTSFLLDLPRLYSTLNRHTNQGVPLDLESARRKRMLDQIRSDGQYVYHPLSLHEIVSKRERRKKEGKPTWAFDNVYAGILNYYRLRDPRDPCRTQPGVCRPYHFLPMHFEWPIHMLGALTLADPNNYKDVPPSGTRKGGWYFLCDFVDFEILLIAEYFARNDFDVWYVASDKTPSDAAQTLKVPHIGLP